MLFCNISVEFSANILLLINDDGLGDMKHGGANGSLDDAADRNFKGISWKTIGQMITSCMSDVLGALDMVHVINHDLDLLSGVIAFIEQHGTSKPCSNLPDNQL